MLMNLVHFSVPRKIELMNDEIDNMGITAPVTIKHSSPEVLLSSLFPVTQDEMQRDILQSTNASVVNWI